MDYDQVAASLVRAGTQADAAELHGSLCGRLCLRGEVSLAEWLAEALSGCDAHSPARVEVARELAALHASVLTELEAGDMTFEPLLPADREALADRTQALALWSTGFLHGLASCGVPEPRVLDEEHSAPHVAEFMGDLAEISRASFESDEDDDGEVAEAAFAELLEFLKVGVLMAYEELAGLRSGVAPEQPSRFS